LKPGKVVIVLQGRYAGKKAVIVKNFDTATKERPYPHAIVAGISKYPKKVVRKMSNAQVEKRSRVVPFIRVYNFSHLLPTRYGVDLDLKSFQDGKAVSDPSAKSEAKKQLKDIFHKRYLSGKNRWFFTKLRF